jgi:hypothetical protein
MALTIPVVAPYPIELGAYMDFIQTQVNPADASSVIASAEKLQALSQNKSLLLQIMHREMLISTTEDDSKFYSAHSFIIGSANGMTVRGNIWPTVSKYQHLDHRRGHVNKVYAYEYPHDHNFNFLTVGWFGPGYETIIYEYNYDDVIGFDGEAVAMTFLERTHLSEGKVMFFREGRDIHTQMPPEQISVSLNLLVRTPRTAKREQYIFDLNETNIRQMATGSDVARTLLAIRFSKLLYNNETIAVLDRLAERSNNGRVRAAARQAIIEIAPELKEHVMRQAHLDTSPHSIQMLSVLK